MKVNLLCLAGAAIGLVSLFFPWWQGAEPGLGLMIDRDYMLVQDLLLDSSEYGSLFVVACTLFLVGTFFAFGSPIGGLVQIPGVMGFFALFGSEIGVHRGEDTVGLGAYLGLISAAIVTVSLLLPLGIGYHLGQKARRASLSSASKFITISWYDETARIRLNLLALGGALIAFVCIALPWSTLSVVSPTPQEVVEQRPLFDYLSGSLATPSSYVFIIGSAIALITTLGVIVQMVGLVWFWAVFANSMGTYPGRGGTLEEAFGTGFYISVVAMLMVAVSIIMPLGPGYYRRRKTARSRVFVWGKAGAKAH
ncbi:MAG: hypothetical protein JW880_05605 [Candidatus Thermoplasmatota archaeon]|nr:hypothetical protein [Candidatus Thermoplasmatota archaeon]